MPRPRRRRREAPADLVLALGAGLEPLEPFPDAVLDALVVARFEMQAVKIRKAPPVAAEEGAAAAKADRRRDRDALVAGDDDDEILGHRPRDLGEELAAEIRRAAAPQESARMKIVHRVPVGRRKLVAAGMLEADARLGDAPPLAPRFLAFLRAERREKLVEISIAAVVPMELTALTGQVPGRGERRAFRLRREETVRG